MSCKLICHEKEPFPVAAGQGCEANISFASVVKVWISSNYVNPIGRVSVGGESFALSVEERFLCGTC